MSTTCLDLIEAAFSRRTANDADHLGTSLELIRVANRHIKAVCARAAGINPYYFGTSNTVAPASSKWVRPADALVVTRVEIDATKAKVNVTPLRDPKAEMPPRVYENGREYFPLSGETNPNASSATLRFYYARQHPDFDSTLAADHATNTLQPWWNEGYSDLLIIPMSIYLAIKDGRPADERAALKEELVELYGTFERELELANYGQAARWGQTPRARSTSPVLGA